MGEHLEGAPTRPMASNSSMPSPDQVRLIKLLGESEKEVARLRDQQRKRPPSEKPGDGEVVLTLSKNGNLGLEKFYDSWIFVSQLDGWWPIKHLLGKQEVGGDA